MGVRLLSGVLDGTSDATVLVDSVRGVAFGPLFASAWEAEAFCGWLGEDPRRVEAGELAAKFARWRALGASHHAEDRRAES